MNPAEVLFYKQPTAASGNQTSATAGPVMAQRHLENKRQSHGRDSTPYEECIARPPKLFRSSAVAFFERTEEMSSKDLNTETLTIGQRLKSSNGFASNSLPFLLWNNEGSDFGSNVSPEIEFGRVAEISTMMEQTCLKKLDKKPRQVTPLFGFSAPSTANGTHVVSSTGRKNSAFTPVMPQVRTVHNYTKGCCSPHVAMMQQQYVRSDKLQTNSKATGPSKHTEIEVDDQPTRSPRPSDPMMSEPLTQDKTHFEPLRKPTVLHLSLMKVVKPKWTQRPSPGLKSPVAIMRPLSFSSQEARNCGSSPNARFFDEAKKRILFGCPSPANQHEELDGGSLFPPKLTPKLYPGMECIESPSENMGNASPRRTYLYYCGKSTKKSLIDSPPVQCQAQEEASAFLPYKN